MGSLGPGFGVSVMIPGLAATGLWRSGSLRPREFGGALPDSEMSQRVIAEGMDPMVVAERALDGVAAGRFLIVTHPHVRAYSDQRVAEVPAAFDGPGTGENESFEVSAIIAPLRSEDS